MLTKIIKLLFVFMPLLLVCGQGLAGSITAGTASTTPGSSAISIPVSLSLGPGQNVSGIQFDVTFAPTAMSLTGTTTGASAAAAGKTANSSTLGLGQARVIISGLNQNSIASGTVANLVFGVPSSAPAGSYPITVSNTILVSPQGTRVTSSGTNGALNVVAVPVQNATPSASAPVTGAKGMVSLSIALICVGMWMRTKSRVSPAFR